MAPGEYRLGCDIGGTFTDFVLLNDQTGEIEIYKCLTTPKDPSEAVQQGVEALRQRAPDCVEALLQVIHGTTLVINAIIERKGARTGLITTAGARDVLEIGREKRYDNYDIFAEYPVPLVPRPLRKEVHERMFKGGRVIQPLRREEVEEVLDELVSSGIGSLAVCFLHSYENPSHEALVKQVARERAPELEVSVSSEVLPEIREYERTSTTVANAYVKPLTKRYMTRLSGRLQDLGFKRKLYIMLSSGGITSVETAKEFPVRLIESGPTAGVIAAEYYGRLFNVRDIFSFDMGGTTAKSCLIVKGNATRVSSFEVARVQRFKKGSGMPIQVPVIDLLEIGAGGGSIARVSKLGLLQVGPDSAGADPGPACYSLGGTEPTVTDGDLALGYLDADYFLGGQMALDRAAAKEAIREKLAVPLGVSETQAAWGIHDLINEIMAAAAKTHIAEKGGNPKTVTLVAFGGAGPVHAYGLAKKLKAPRILVPPVAGVGSAFGFFTAPTAFDLVRTNMRALSEANFDEVEELFASMEREGAQVLEQAGPIESILYERSVDMRYVGQGYEVNVPLPFRDCRQTTARAVQELFDEVYRSLYGRTYPEVPLEFVSFRVRARLPEKPLEFPKIEDRGTLPEARKGTRLAYSDEAQEYVPFAVYDRYRLSPGASFRGPAIVEERESTTVVQEGGAVAVDEYGFLWITLGGNADE
ncbi:MAG: hydantoinase/oxoprolinase family protein [Deltaproteobacteria bacterium]|nr:hydantoinase/oxoprolinase family protein [Deltaproteobacteria bacterium]